MSIVPCNTYKYFSPVLSTHDISKINGTEVGLTFVIRRSTFECRKSKQFDVQQSNFKSQNSLTFDIRMSKFKTV